MRELRIASEQKPVLLKEPDPIVAKPTFVTQEQFDVGINSVVDKLANRLEPESALTPQVRGMVKAVGEVQSLRLALKDPTSAGIEEATSTLVTTVLGNALQNMTGGGQQAAAPTPLKNTLAQIAISNLTGDNSPLPQILDSLTNILGKDKVREGYDVGMKALENQQSQSSLPNIVLQLNENNQADVVDYAKQMGYTDVGYAQQKLIEHKNRLFQEIDEIQNVQQGGQQSIVEEPTYEEPTYEEPVQAESYVGEQQILTDEKSVITQQDENNQIEVVKKPVLKADKVVILHSKPRTLSIVNDESNVNSNESNVVNNSQDEYSDNNEIPDIDNIINELGEQNE